jgi:hypothetical protein
LLSSPLFQFSSFFIIQLAMTVCILKLQVSLVNIHEHAICGHSFTEDLRAAPTHSLGFNQRESKLAERVRDVEEENHILRKQLRLAHHEKDWFMSVVFYCQPFSKSTFAAAVRSAAAKSESQP